MINAKDPGKGHFYVSLIKSVIRIAACVGVVFGGGVMTLAIGFLLAELLGLVEEMV
jgi:hypothetical protein